MVDFPAIVSVGSVGTILLSGYILHRIADKRIKIKTSDLETAIQSYHKLTEKRNIDNELLFDQLGNYFMQQEVSSLAPFASPELRDSYFHQLELIKEILDSSYRTSLKDELICV